MRKLKFDANFGFQLEAIQATTDICRGTEELSKQVLRSRDRCGGQSELKYTKATPIIDDFAVVSVRDAGGDLFSVFKGGLRMKGGWRMKYVFVWGLLLCCGVLEAKRIPPPEVELIAWKEYQVSTYHKPIYKNGYNPNGPLVTPDGYEVGIILKTKEKTRKSVTVFSYLYNQNLEKDVQDTYIAKLNDVGDYLRIETEGNGLFLYSYKTGQIILVKIPSGCVLTQPKIQFESSFFMRDLK